MNQTVIRVNEKNLCHLAWQRGFRGVTGLAKKLGKHRTSIHRAAKYPDQFPDLFARIERRLITKEVVNG